MKGRVRYQVFISSTFEDLQNERQKVSETLLKDDYIVAGMELFPATDDEQFEFIKSVIDDSDYYVVIVGGRYGSAASDGIGYTEKEYRYALEKRLPISALIHDSPSEIAVARSETDPDKISKLEAFKAELRTGRITDSWKSPDELATKVLLSLNRNRERHSRPGWVRGDTVQGLRPDEWQPSTMARVDEMHNQFAVANNLVAYAHYSPSQTELLDSSHVSSVTDNGVGDFTIHFTCSLEANSVVALPMGTTPQFKVLEVASDHVRVKFEEEPELVQVRIDGLAT